MADYLKDTHIVIGLKGVYNYIMWKHLLEKPVYCKTVKDMLSENIIEIWI